MLEDFCSKTKYKDFCSEKFTYVQHQIIYHTDYYTGYIGCDLFETIK